MFDPTGSDEFAIAYLPFYHAYGFWTVFLNLIRGRTTIIMKKYTPEKVLSSIEKYQVSKKFSNHNFLDFIVFTSSIAAHILGEVSVGRKI